jgi:hypothetical protein
VSTTGQVGGWIAVLALLAMMSGVCFYRLGTAPMYFGGDEARFVVAAQSIATTGKDETGARLPLLFHMSDATDVGTRWYQPVLVYLMAVTFKVVPPSEGAARLPVAALALVDLWLMFMVARHLFPGDADAVAAVAILALSPALLIFSRQALDYACPLPFIIGWLWALSAFGISGALPQAAAAGGVLGIGIYSYLASWMMMPLYLLMTWIEMFRRRSRALPAIVAAGLAFAIPILLLIPWLWQHPAMLRDTISRYGVYDVRRLGPLQGAKDFLNYNNVQERISIYWDYFNPAFLFLSGGSNLTTGTRRAGVFPAAAVVLLVVGFAELWRRRREPITLVILVGFLLAPIPATLAGERYAIQRALYILPFGALIAAAGVSAMRRDRRALVRAAAAALLVSMPIQYAFFCRDYFGDYRVRSAYWFDPENFRAIAEYIVARDLRSPLSTVYISADVDDARPRWTFYLAKSGRAELQARTVYVDSRTIDLDRVTPGSLLVLYRTDPAVPTLLATGKCSLAKLITDQGGHELAVVLERNAPAPRRQT